MADRGTNVLSSFKNSPAWKILDTYTSGKYHAFEWGEFGKGEAGVDYGIDYDLHLNPIEKTDMHGSIESEAHPYNSDGDFRDATEVNYVRDDNIKKQKNKSVTNQKYQTKGKQSLLTEQSTRSKGGGRSGGGGKGLIGNQTAKDPTGLSMLYKKLN